MPELKDIPADEVGRRVAQAIDLDGARHVELDAQDPDRLKWTMRWSTGGANGRTATDG